MTEPTLASRVTLVLVLVTALGSVAAVAIPESAAAHVWVYDTCPFGEVEVGGSLWDPHVHICIPNP